MVFSRRLVAVALTVGSVWLLPATSAQEGKGRTCPDQYPNRDPGCDLSEQASQDPRRFVPRQGEIRGQVPAGHMDVRPGILDRVHHRPECLRPVDQHGDRIPRPRRWLPRSPPARRRIDGCGPAHTREAAPVVRNREPLDQLAERAVGHIERAFRRHLR